MKRLGTSALVALVIVIAWPAYEIIRTVTLTMAGASGLGAVSFGASERLVEFTVLTAVVWACLFVRSKVRRSRDRRDGISTADQAGTNRR